MPFLNRMPNEKFTFIEYYKKKYGVLIEDPSQPLLRISNARARPDMRNPVSRLDETRGGQIFQKLSQFFYFEK